MHGLQIFPSQMSKPVFGDHVTSNQHQYILPWVHGVQICGYGRSPRCIRKGLCVCVILLGVQKINRHSPGTEVLGVWLDIPLHLACTSPLCLKVVIACETTQITWKDLEGRSA